MIAILRFIFNHPLSSHQKARALLRFLAWQFKSRFLGAEHICSWVNNVRFHVRRHEVGLTGNLYTGLHEFEDMGFLLHFLRPGDLFLDVGANSGSYTLLAAGAIGARSLSFEPVPETFRRLQRNIRLNALEGLSDCRNMGIGAQQGILEFSTGNDSTNHVLMAGEKGTDAVSIAVDALDTLLQDLPCPRLIKVDVEGFEAPVVEGAAKLLLNPVLNGVIMELNGSSAVYGYDEAVIIGKMLDCGFTPYRYDPWSRNLQAMTGKNPQAGNTLFLRNLPFVEERVSKAPPFRVYGATI